MADLLLIGILATGVTAAASSDRLARPIRLAAAVAVTLVLIVGTALTGSRTGISLLLLVVPLQGLLLCGLLEVRQAKWLGLTLAGLVLLFAAGAYLLHDNLVVDRTAARFLLGEDPRVKIWEDTRFAIAQLWPWGAGLGNFTPALLAIERLEVVDPTSPNRAHNDYLEFALEAGLPGYILGAAAAVVVLALVIRAWRAPPFGWRAVLFSLGTLAIIALHSLVDYPLRSMALAVLVGSGVGMLAPSVHLRQSVRGTSPKRLVPG